MDIVLAGSTVARALNDDQMGRISIDLSADGTEVGAGTIVLDDPTGGDEIRDGRQAKVSEGVALIVDGFIGTQDKGRGNVKAQPAREDIYQIQDANALLYGKRFVNRSRGAETDRARVLAFAGFDLSGVATTWVLNTNTATLPAKKYTGNDWSELMTDVFEATGKLIFIHDKADGTGRCLHSHKETEGHTCGLTISDDPGTAGTANTFSLANATRNRAGGVGNLVNDTYGRDGANRHSTDSDATSITAHDADGLKHQAIVEFEAGSQSELDAKTTAYTDENKDEIDIYEGDIGPLDQDHLLLIRQGDRITVTCQAVGLSASTIRIAHMTLTVARDRSGKPVPGYWIAHLELNEAIRLRDNGARRSTSGSQHVTRNEMLRTVQPFCIPMPQIETFTRTESGGLGLTEFTGDGWTPVLDAAAQSVNGSAAVLVCPGGTAVENPVTSYVLLPWTLPIEMLIRFKLELGSFGAIVLPDFAGMSIWLGGSGQHSISGAKCSIEVASGVSSSGVTAHLEGSGVGLAVVDPSISHASSMLGNFMYLRVRIEERRMAIALGTTAPTVYEDDDSWVGLTTFPVPALLGIGAHSYKGTILTVDSIQVIEGLQEVCDPAPTEAPAGATPILAEFVAIADGSTSAYSTTYPYRPGSLRVYTDELAEPLIIETSPAAGTFTFQSNPFATERIVADYVAA